MSILFCTQPVAQTHLNLFRICLNVNHKQQKRSLCKDQNYKILPKKLRKPWERFLKAILKSIKSEPETTWQLIEHYVSSSLSLQCSVTSQHVLIHPFEQGGNPFKLGTVAAIIRDATHFSPHKSIVTVRAVMHVQYVLSHYVRRGANEKWHKCSRQKHKQDRAHIS